MFGSPALSAVARTREWSSWSPVESSPARERNTSHLYVVYYGWLSDSEGEPNESAKAIAEAMPDLVVASPMTSAPRRVNASPQVLALIRSSGVKMSAYVSTRWGERDVGHIRSEIAELANLGVDGVFLDETPTPWSGKQRGNQRVVTLARDLGLHIIVNTGVARNHESVLETADVLMVEHAWRELAIESPWSREYPADRFMGCSSNEPGAPPKVGHTVGLAQAVADTSEAWARGIGWYTATDRFAELPVWLKQYADQARNIAGNHSGR